MGKQLDPKPDIGRRGWGKVRGDSQLQAGSDHLDFGWHLDKQVVADLLGLSPDNTVQLFLDLGIPILDREVSTIPRRQLGGLSCLIKLFLHERDGLPAIQRLLILLRQNGAWEECAYHLGTFTCNLSIRTVALLPKPRLLAPQVLQILLYVSILDVMQPFIAAMLKVRKAFYTAIVRSLLRTKHILQTILNIWISPSIIKGENVEEGASNYGTARVGLQHFLEVVERSFRDPVEEDRLVTLSDGLRAQMLKSMLDNPLCMLPSYNHRLPSGEEQGTFVALDVGGSTFRVALVELARGRNGRQECRILTKASSKIDNSIRQLKGVLFFDWMAEKIEQTLSGQIKDQDKSLPPLSMGMAWSFPIEQTSLRSGLLQGMGKGFLAAHGLLGQDLGDLIQASCSKRGLNVQLDAIVNDSSATLLSKAYLDSTTRFGLILGTGVNAAVHLPVRSFSPSKFGVRPTEWHDSAEHVIVNTELSMFGANILPSTKWDSELRAVHPMPEFQPLEHFVSGGYLGEIVRLVLIEGIQTAGLFGGVIPPSLRERYSLETETISRIESDRSPTLTNAYQVFASRHPSSLPPSFADMQALRDIASHITYRASGCIAAGVHALWQVRNEAESVATHEASHTLVAYNGSVIENYPNFRTNCQRHLDTLVEASGGKKGVIELIYAEESSLLGAAVAGAVARLDG